MSRRPNPSTIYPGRCQWCGSAFEREHIEYADSESVGPSWDNFYGVYECGVMLDDVQVWYGAGERVDDERTLKPWDERVQKPGQTKACRTIMELRWKTDPEQLEKDRTDPRTLADIVPEVVAEWAREEAARNQLERMRVWAARLDQGSIWTDADGDEHTIPDMTRDYRINVLRWLEARARWYLNIVTTVFYSYPAPTSDGAGLAWLHEENDLARAGRNPEDWMRGTTLYRSIKQSLADDAPEDRRATA